MFSCSGGGLSSGDFGGEGVLSVAVETSGGKDISISDCGGGGVLKMASTR